MNQEPTLAALRAAFAVGNTVQRIVPENDRYRWEQQWLKENREVSGIVGHDATALAAPAEDSMATAALVDTACATAAATMPSPLRMSESLPAQPSSAAAAPSFDAIAAQAAAAAYRTMAAPPQPLRDAAPGLPAQEPPLSGAPLAARWRTALKQFALWRSDDEVCLALRLDESADDAGATIGALRRWLQDMQLKLGTLIVNGELRWQSRPKDGKNYY